MNTLCVWTFHYKWVHCQCLKKPLSVLQDDILAEISRSLSTCEYKKHSICGTWQMYTLSFPVLNLSKLVSCLQRKLPLNYYIQSKVPLKHNKNTKSQRLQMHSHDHPSSLIGIYASSPKDVMRILHTYDAENCTALQQPLHLSSWVWPPLWLMLLHLCTLSSSASTCPSARSQADYM